MYLYVGPVFLSWRVRSIEFPLLGAFSAEASVISSCAAFPVVELTFPNTSQHLILHYHQPTAQDER